MTGLNQVREFALGLPGATEEPHFDMISFRVRGKIFLTVPPGEAHLHVFVDRGEIEAAVAEFPAAFEPLMWGRRVAGVRVSLAEAPAGRVLELVGDAWRRKAPASLIAELSDRQG